MNERFWLNRGIAGAVQRMRVRVMHIQFFWFFFFVTFQMSNYPFTDLIIIIKNHWENTKRHLEINFNFFFPKCMRCLCFFFILSNTRLFFIWLDNYEKNHGENTKKPIFLFLCFEECFNLFNVLLKYKKILFIHNQFTNNYLAL